MASDGAGEGRKDHLEGGRDKIGLSYWQAKEIRRAIREKGMRRLIHGNTGRPSYLQNRYDSSLIAISFS